MALTTYCMYLYFKWSILFFTEVLHYHKWIFLEFFGGFFSMQHFQLSLQLLRNTLKVCASAGVNIFVVLAETTKVLTPVELNVFTVFLNGCNHSWKYCMKMFYIISNENFVVVLFQKYFFSFP